MHHWPTDQGVFALGDLPLSAGGVLKDARLSWKTHGRLSPARDNVVLYPTSYSARHPDLEWLIGPHAVLDPERWFIVIPDMFGNGLSSSPSNTPDWPALVTHVDNVRAQRQLLETLWGVTHLHAAYGWSMGAQQAYHWAALYPHQIARAIICCGSARTATFNTVFLLSLLAALEAAPEYLGQGRFSAEPQAAIRAFGRIYAGWALSEEFYRAGLHESALGAADLETFLVTDWEARFARRPAADLYAQLLTWKASDIARGGDLDATLAAIEARVLLMPGETDRYFPVADNLSELAHLRHAKLHPIPSIWGHRAGNPTHNHADAAFISEAVRTWLG
jgi:homoserine O-acetyltransferase